jgi:MFS family permease
MFTLWFQLQGFSDFQASLLTAVYGFGCAVGSFLGGALGDWADKKLPARGRVIVVQLAIINGLPLSTLLLKGLPVPPVPIDTIEETIAVGASSALCALYFFVLLCMGLVISWCGVNNSAIFADLVPERLRSQIYAFDRSFEGAVGACGAPLVGISAEKLFGFRGTMAAAATGAQERVAAAQALSSALLLCLIVPWLASLAFYCLLYWTYRADKLAAAKMSKVASGKGYAEVELGEGDMHHNERGLPSGLVTTAKGKVSVE